MRSACSLCAKRFQVDPQLPGIRRSRPTHRDRGGLGVLSDDRGPWTVDRDRDRQIPFSVDQQMNWRGADRDEWDRLCGRRV